MRYKTKWEKSSENTRLDDTEENGKTYGYLEQKAKSINESTEPASGRTSKQVKLL